MHVIEKENARQNHHFKLLSNLGFFFKKRKKLSLKTIMTELRKCISEISNTVVFLFGFLILLLKRVRLNNTKCKADGGEENFFMIFFFS